MDRIEEKIREMLAPRTREEKRKRVLALISENVEMREALEAVRNDFEAFRPLSIPTKMMVLRALRGRGS